MASDLPDVYLKFTGQWGGKPLKGECMDDHHPGEEGWVQITSFSFGFGSGSGSGATEDAFDFDKAMAKATTKEEIEKVKEAYKAHQAQAKAKSKPKTGEAWGHSGLLDFDKFSFSKHTDRLSPVLVAISHAGTYKIPKVEVEAVRYGGASTNFKIPFLRLIFEEVYIKSCKLNLVNEDLPTEDIELEYDVVKMETLWTDNATGERLTQEPIRVGWNVPENVQAS